MMTLFFLCFGYKRGALFIANTHKHISSPPFSPLNPSFLTTPTLHSFSPPLFSLSPSPTLSQTIQQSTTQKWQQHTRHRHRNNRQPLPPLGLASMHDSHSPVPSPVVPPTALLPQSVSTSPLISFSVPLFQLNSHTLHAAILLSDSYSVHVFNCMLLINRCCQDSHATRPCHLQQGIFFLPNKLQTQRASAKQ